MLEFSSCILNLKRRSRWSRMKIGKGGLQSWRSGRTPRNRWRLKSSSWSTRVINWQTYTNLVTRSISTGDRQVCRRENKRWEHNGPHDLMIKWPDVIPILSSMDAPYLDSFCPLRVCNDNQRKERRLRREKLMACDSLWKSPHAASTIARYMFFITEPFFSIKKPYESIASLHSLLIK